MVFILILALIPFAQACFSPTDNLAVEVYFDKPGIAYNLEPLKNAENVLIENGRLIYRSHYDERVAVMLWEDRGLHLRIEIPVKSWNSSSREPKILDGRLKECFQMFPKAMHITSLSKKLYIGLNITRKS